MIRVASGFAQVLAMLDRYGFDRTVWELDAERGAKGFRSWLENKGTNAAPGTFILVPLPSDGTLIQFQ